MKLFEGMNFLITNASLGVYKRLGLLIIGIVTLILFAYIIGSMAALHNYGIIPLALVLAICGAFLIFRWPLIGLVLTIFSVPLGSVALLTGNRAFSAFMIPLLVGLYGSRVLIFYEEIKLDHVSKLALAFIVWGIIICLWAYDPQVSLISLGRLIKWIALYVLILNYCRTKQDLRIITLSFTAGAIVAATGAIFMGTTFGDPELTSRVSFGEGYNPNVLGAMLSTGIVFILYYFYKAKFKLLKVILILSIIPIGYSLIKTQSRTAWIAIPASLLISIVLTTRNLQLIRKSLILVTVLIGLVVSAYYTGIINEDIIERYNTIFSGDTRSATSYRNEVWRVGLEMINDNPLHGIGFNNFGLLFDHYAIGLGLTRGQMDPHNTFVGILAETGLVGFILFIGMFIYLFKCIWLVTDPLTRLMLMWLFNSFILINSGGTYHSVPWFWFVLVVVALEANLEKQTN